MSKLFVVSVRDSATGMFSPPQVVSAQQQAIRGLSDQVNSSTGGMVADHPEDFELYCLGMYDDQNGKLAAAEMPELICRAKDLVKVKN